MAKIDCQKVITKMTVMNIMMIGRNLKFLMCRIYKATIISPSDHSCTSQGGLVSLLDPGGFKQSIRSNIMACKGFSLNWPSGL